MATLRLYVDGAYFNTTPDRTFGSLIVIDDLDIVQSAYRLICTAKEFVKTQSQGGELSAGLLALMYIKRKLMSGEEYTHGEIYHDYNGTANFIGRGSESFFPQAGASIAYYHSAMDLIKDIECDSKTSVHYHWVKGHSGDRYNEIADKIAKGEEDYLRNIFGITYQTIEFN